MPPSPATPKRKPRKGARLTKVVFGFWNGHHLGVPNTHTQSLLAVYPLLPDHQRKIRLKTIFYSIIECTTPSIPEGSGRRRANILKSACCRHFCAMQGRRGKEGTVARRASTISVHVSPMYCSLVRGQRWWALFCRHGGPEDVSTVQPGLLGC
jgi:hypothetical protein